VSDMIKLAEGLIRIYEDRLRNVASIKERHSAEAAMESDYHRGQFEGGVLMYEQALREVIDDLHEVIKQAPRGGEFLNRLSLGISFRF
jgi:hypothetical protein